MAASNATKSAGTPADVNPNIIIYRPITWKDVDAVVELLRLHLARRMGALAGTRFSLLISRYFVLHDLQLDPHSPTPHSPLTARSLASPSSASPQRTPPV